MKPLHVKTGELLIKTGKKDTAQELPKTSLEISCENEYFHAEKQLCGNFYSNINFLHQIGISNTTARRFF